MFDKTEIKSELSLTGTVAVALKLNNLCLLLVQKGVITEEELKNLNDISVKEAAAALLGED